MQSKENFSEKLGARLKWIQFVLQGGMIIYTFFFFNFFRVLGPFATFVFYFHIFPLANPKSES